MTPFLAYCNWLAIRAHFGSWKYDFFRYKGKTRANRAGDTFDRKPDRWVYEKLSRRMDCNEFLVTCAICKPSQWIGASIRDSELDDLHAERRRRVESLSYVLSQEILEFGDDFDANFKETPSSIFPPVVALYLGKKVSLETLAVLGTLSGAVQVWRESPDFVMKQTTLLAGKYYPWIECDVKKVGGIVVKQFGD